MTREREALEAARGALRAFDRVTMSGPADAVRYQAASALALLDAALDAPAAPAAPPSDWRERAMKAVYRAHSQGRSYHAGGQEAPLRDEIQRVERDAAQYLDAPAESDGEDEAVLDGLISDLADDLASEVTSGQRERLLGAFRVLLADVLTSVRAARDAEWRDGQVFSSAKPESPGCGSCDDGQVMVDGWWQPCAKCAPKPGEEA